MVHKSARHKGKGSKKRCRWRKIRAQERVRGIPCVWGRAARKGGCAHSKGLSRYSSRSTHVERQKGWCKYAHKKCTSRAQGEALAVRPFVLCGIAILFFATALANCQNAREGSETRIARTPRGLFACKLLIVIRLAAATVYCSFCGGDACDDGGVGLLIFADFMPRLCMISFVPAGRLKLYTSQLATNSHVSFLVLYALKHCLGVTDLMTCAIYCLYCGFGLFLI